MGRSPLLRSDLKDHQISLMSLMRLKTRLNPFKSVSKSVHSWISRAIMGAMIYNRVDIHNVG